MKYYIVNFDRKLNVSYGKFHKEFTESAVINGWFHYIKSAYIVGSRQSVEKVSDHFTACAKNNDIDTTHLVVEVNLSNRQGMLVDDAWAWLRKNAKG
jgi:hypothetical protein